VASGLSSGITTPLDVIKTRLATGMLPPGSPVIQSILHIAKSEGVRALYAGVQARVLWSAMYGGIGLTCFEATKRILTAIETQRMKDYELTIHKISSTE
jgi:solute carrier family 25 S-adenosylmethionine transporter 26